MTKGKKSHDQEEKNREWIENWKFYISVPICCWPYHRVEATIVDIGHSDRGCILELKEPVVLKSEYDELQKKVIELEDKIKIAKLAIINAKSQLACKKTLTESELDSLDLLDRAVVLILNDVNYQKR